MLSYWLSWYVLLSGLKDGINPYVCPLAIVWVKEVGWPSHPFYLGSLPFYRLDECIGNISEVGWALHEVTHADTTFLQIFLWE